MIPEIKVATIVGTRPQFVKAATVSRAVKAQSRMLEIIVHTGQHFDSTLSQVFFKELGIDPPASSLGIHGGPHGQMTARMLSAIEELLIRERPQGVLVYGDTNSTLAGALAASKLNIPLVHVEAGLRSFDRSMPEEVNRVITDHVSDLLFCPTPTAVMNLSAEGISQHVHWVGDVMYDAALEAARGAEGVSSVLERLGVENRAYGVATVHRAANTDDHHALREIVDYLKNQANDRPIVFPIHPRTRSAVEQAGFTLDPLRVCVPLGYLEMRQLVSHAAVVYTDSGGLQKEAYFYRVPCVTLRDETEWVETISSGWNRLWKDRSYLPRRQITDYGDGKAAEEIERILHQFLEQLVQ